MGEREGVGVGGRSSATLDTSSNTCKQIVI